jgi:hypothetical protein
MGLNEMQMSVGLSRASGDREKYLISLIALTALTGNIFLFWVDHFVFSRSLQSTSKMAVSDMLNRRVRARPDDEEVYSEASGSDDDVSQEGIGPDSDDIQSEV